MAETLLVETDDGVRLHGVDSDGSGRAAAGAADGPERSGGPSVAERSGAPSVTERETVLFLHEYAGGLGSWDGQIAGLRDEFRCVAFAARGYPPSDVPLDQSAYSWQRAVDDAVAVLDALGIARAHVVGVSMGGYTALQLGLTRPERVRSILAVSAGSGSDPATRDAYLREASAVADELRARGARAIGESMAEGPSRLQLKRRDRRAWEDMIEQFAGHSAEGLALTMTGIQSRRPSLHDLVDELARLTVPLLVIDGDEDEACLPAGLLLKRVVPSCGLQVLPHSGHVPNLEDPEQFNAIVRRFVRTVAAGEWPSRDPRTLQTAQFGLDDESMAAAEAAPAEVAPAEPVAAGQGAAR